jgi:transcriptional regulator with XRE-family HTH domain
MFEIENRIRERLADAIITSGMSLTEIARKVGVSIATIGYYKSKEKLPTVPTLAVLCKVLDISSDELLGLR